MLVGVLAGLLAVLGVLQYRWIGTLSAAEAARMHRTLRLGVTGFSEAVYQPLDRLYEHFLIDLLADDDALASILAARYRRWQATADHPALLAGLYHVTFAPDGTPRLAHFDAEAGALASQSWPQALAAWQVYFHQIDVRPSLPVQPPGLPVPLLAPPGTDRAGFLLLMLDERYAAETLFPSLAQTYLLPTDDADYTVRVVTHEDPGRVLYQSHDVAPATPPAAEAILGLRGRVEITTHNRGDEEAFVTILRSDSVRTPDVAMRVTEDERVVLGDAPRRAAAQTTGPVQPWRLAVHHRAGSIEAAVGRWRRRNLGVSFGILLLLGGAAGLLTISARRARRLAAQQMAFVAGVTHELRTPLAVIRSAAENLADGIVDDPAQARRYGTLIDAEGRRLSALVEQALALAGAHAQAPPTLRPLALGPFLDEAIARCRRTFEPDVPVALDLEKDLPPILADARALEAALCNLLGNAHKYGGGWIGVEARRQQDVVALTVRDRGAGIPADELPHVFEPFFRGRAAREAQVRGSGLGLSLVQRTAETLGGRVGVETTPGRGSAFTLYLPLAPADA